MLHNTLPEVFLTLLNEANCPKSHAKITCVRRKLNVLCISSIAIPEKKINDVKYALFSNPYFLYMRNIPVYFTPWLESELDQGLLLKYDNKPYGLFRS